MAVFRRPPSLLAPPTAAGPFAPFAARRLSGQSEFSSGRQLNLRSPRPSSRPFTGFAFWLTGLLGAAWLWGAGAAAAAETVDLSELGARGLSQRSREIIVVQALSPRARPPLEMGFVMDLAAYGGDELALAYLEMDAASAQQSSSPLPADRVKALMSSGVPAEDVKKIVASARTQAQSAPLFTALAGSAAVASVAASDQPAGSAAAAPDQPVVAPAAPQAPAPPRTAGGGAFTVEDLMPSPAAEDWGEAVKGAGPSAPIVAAVEAAPALVAAPLAPVKPPTAAELRKVPQTLAPGQSADPSRPLPAAPGPYYTREPRSQGGLWMGVRDEIKPDGHRVETHANGRQGLQGQEVLSRASGRKVYRHFSGRTEREKPASRGRAVDEQAYDDWSDDSSDE
ncbi:MAG: hypothetical protein LBU12_06455 [Deltaproteobacteria bacterium]|jgi:hypothetical protein|nr:hypothetical protein [Deltaproteobacteria bacterium]